MKSLSGNWLGCLVLSELIHSSVWHRLVKHSAHLVAGGVSDICSVECWGVVEAESRCTLVFAAVGECSGMEFVHCFAGWRVKGNVHTIPKGRLTSIVWFQYPKWHWGRRIVRHNRPEANLSFQTFDLMPS